MLVPAPGTQTPPPETPETAEIPEMPEAPAPAVAPAPGAFPTVFPPPVQTFPKPKRLKALRTTAGLAPTAPDFGAEADLVSVANVDSGAPRPRRWTYSLKGYLRAPMMVSVGPRSDGFPGSEPHAPIRVPGATPDEWRYLGLTPTPTASLYLTIENPNVSANVILAANYLNDSGYDNLDQMGAISQAYVTLKAPGLFGMRGGLAWSVGSFSNRYGMAGPRGASSGYYGTYLFGRTHVAGESLTANLDVSDRLELVAEHGFGAKLDVVPWELDVRRGRPPVAAYLPEQGPVPQGSNFVHHGHLALLWDGWLQVAGHHLISWTPNDLGSFVGSMRLRSATLTVMGGELRIDRPVAGSGYIGYSYVRADRIFALSDGVQVLHGANGLGFAENFFGPVVLLPQTDPAVPADTQLGPRSDSGSVHTVLFQHVLRLNPLLGKTTPERDVALAVYGMYHHINVETHDPTATTLLSTHTQDRLKIGGELQFFPWRFLAVGARIDRVMPDGPNNRLAFSAVSPRAIIHTNWLSREYIVVNYTRYFIGEDVALAQPFVTALPNDMPRRRFLPDRNLLVISALISF
jgi:hypothetical protein